MSDGRRLKPRTWCMGRVRRLEDGRVADVELDPSDAQQMNLRAGDRVILEDGADVSDGEVRQLPDRGLFVRAHHHEFHRELVRVRRPAGPGAPRW